ncbi:MAG: hypothetical protein SFZ23_04380 [Planctomycetota bacterium]|nr:hypothetical protein [Planctomycetota bacterium]
MGIVALLVCVGCSKATDTEHPKQQPPPGWQKIEVKDVASGVRVVAPLDLPLVYSAGAIQKPDFVVSVGRWKDQAGLANLIAVEAGTEAATAGAGEPSILLEQGASRTWNGVPRLTTRRHQGTVAFTNFDDPRGTVQLASPQMAFIAVVARNVLDGTLETTYRLVLLQDEAGKATPVTLTLAPRNGLGDSKAFELREPSYVEWTESDTTVRFGAGPVLPANYATDFVTHLEDVIAEAKRASAPAASIGSVLRPVPSGSGAPGGPGGPPGSSTSTGPAGPN